jgi:dynein assembly factor 1
MKNLACLYLKNNPLVREFKNYRKRFIGFIPTLKYLDDRPVFPNERRTSDAWVIGGETGE